MFVATRLQTLTAIVPIPLLTLECVHRKSEIHSERLNLNVRRSLSKEDASVLEMVLQNLVARRLLIQLAVKPS